MLIKKYKLLMFIIGFMLFGMLCNIHTAEARESFDNKADFTGDGELIYTTEDTKHKSNIRWRTIGFVICKKKYYGYPKVTKNNVLMISSANKYSVDKGNGKLETTFTWSKSYVLKAMEKAGITRETLQREGGKFYLNGIIEVYNGKTGKAIGKPHYNIYSIMHAQSWRNPNDFKDRYDIAVVFPPNIKVPVRMKYFAWKNGGWVNVTNKAPNYVSGSYVDLGERPYGGTYEMTHNQPASLTMPETVNGQTKNKTFHLFRSDWNKIGEPKKLKDKKFAEGNPYLNENAFNTSVSRKVQKRTYSINSSSGIVINYYYKKFAKPKQYTEEQLDPNLTCTINSFHRGHEIYNSEVAIPSTEDQYVWITCKEYLYKVTYDNIKNYTLHSSNGTTVKRWYYYTKIKQADVWRVRDAETINNTLPQGSIVINIDASEFNVSAGSLNASVGHGGIISSPTTDPETGEVSYYVCVSDYMVLTDGRGNELINIGIVSNSEYECKSSSAEIEEGVIGGGMGNTTIPGLTVGDSALYKRHLNIPEKTSNGTHESVCNAYYENIFHYNENDGSDGRPYPSYDIHKDAHFSEDEYKSIPSKVSINSIDEPESINAVIVLTPVVCDGTVSIDKANNQEISPAGDELAQIVLDHEFSINLPTEGWHSDNKGYGERDYKKYTAKREVKFNFDTYSKNQQIFYPKNTWIEVLHDYETFYLPTWVDETFGEYAKAQFRTTAINNTAAIVKTQELANEDGEEFYGAHDSTDIHISGSVFGLSLYDISDYPLWRNVFREDNSLKLKNSYRYYVGNRNKNGYNIGINSKNTFPLFEGSHQFYINKGVLKTGYTWRFSVKTIGNYVYDDDCIRIRPRFYFVDSNGTREEVDVWYSATGKDNHKEYLVKAGSSRDSSNRKKMSLGDPYTTVPDKEIKDKAALTGKPEEELKRYVETYNYGKINVGENMRTYIGKDYNEAVLQTIPETVSASKAAMSVQKWYFQYHLPGEIHICRKDFDVTKYADEHDGIDYSEDFWITEGGYLDINFDITTVKGKTRSNVYSTYYIDVSNPDDPVYSELYDVEGNKVWEEHTYDQVMGMTDEEKKAFEDMYNSYDNDGGIYTELQDALDAGKLKDELRDFLDKINGLGEENEEDDMEITKDPFEMGTDYLSYINSDNASRGYCNMWHREGFDVNKKDAFEKSYPLKDGDVLFCYIVPDKSVDDDYISSGTN